MPSSAQGSIRLFRYSEIDVFLHWSWFFVAIYEINTSRSRYPSIIWNIAEYLAIFAIVTLHEFGHAFACRQVGGTANKIVLWPLGGVAYVDPPQRPGATLWSIAAGPLVNVALAVIFFVLVKVARITDFRFTAPHTYHLLTAVSYINIGLLIFNVLPVYPLDGGQILRALLWFKLGLARSLKVATVIGMIGAVALIGAGIWMQWYWTALISVYLVINCWAGFQYARLLSLAEANATASPMGEGYVGITGPRNDGPYDPR